MDSISFDTGLKTLLAVSVLTLAIFVPLLRYLFSAPSFPKNAPKVAAEQYPIIGALQFFTHRCSWFERQTIQSKTGAFSFHVGNKSVIGLSGEQGRKVFYETKALAFGPAYSGMLAGTPTVSTSSNPLNEERIETQDDFSLYFTKRIVAILKGPVLNKGLPRIIEDVCHELDLLAGQEQLTTKPFNSIYNTVYKLTMRTLGCNEIADNDTLLEETAKYFSIIDKSTSPWMVMYSWLPTFGKAKRMYGGARLYMIFQKIVDERKKTGRDGGDALQFLMDEGDDITKIITFILGALFAGQLNTGISAAHILCCLANDKIWYNRVWEEVNAVANRYSTDKTLPLKEQLKMLPLEAWEKDFPTIDYCLKDSIRLSQIGAAFRMNTTNRDIPIGQGEVIPPGAYVAWHFADTSFNTEIYPSYEQWDPSRYLPDRAEDKKEPYAWTGWGAGRHPCLGMRFAKLEINVIVAFFFAYFEDFETVDATGKSTSPPMLDKERHTAGKPKEDIWLRYKPRKE